MTFALDGYVPPALVLGTAAILLALRSRARPSLSRSGRVAIDAGTLLFLIALAAALELGMGRTPSYRKGPIELWSGEVRSDQNSQQIADPYTFTHLVHGAALYGIASLVTARNDLGSRVVLAIAIQSAWEVLENTDMVIERYRAETISLDYYGDSVVNSVSDVVTCLLGVFLAAWLPPRATLAWAVLIEAILLVWIRDNLTLNIVMLIYPIERIAAWQRGG